jgi:murein DD-endopeptidase MepM/ murein hydrolase activator NlpD
VCSLLVEGAEEGPGAWLEVVATPAPVVVYRSGELADTILDLDLANRNAFRIRVERVGVAFLNGEREIGSSVLEQEFFKDPVFPRSARFDRGQHLEWKAICLDSVPPATDRLRFDFELSGTRKLQTVQSLDVAAVPGPEPVRMRLPFAGPWVVTQGHGCSSNHRTGKFGGEFAWDFVAVGPEGAESPAYRKSHLNKDAFGFGQPIVAPAAGRVVRVVADVLDNDGLDSYPRHSLLETLERPEWVFGNFVVVDVGASAFILLGHLRHGSIAVAPGQLVSAGDRIGECGNSGNAQIPHLHLQVMDRSDPTHPEVRGVPGLLMDYVAFSEPHERERSPAPARRVEAGDPLQGSVIAPGGGDFPGPGG